MRFDLAFGFDHEAQVPAVATQARGHADGVAAGVPERIQQAGAAVEFVEAVGAPGEVVGFLLRGLAQLGAHRRVTRHCGLPRIQRLRADLARVVDAHQPGRMAAGGLVEFRLRVGFARVDALRLGPCEHGVQGALELAEPVVERTVVADERGQGHGALERWAAMPYARPPSRRRASHAL